MHILWSTLGAHSIQWYVVFVIGLPLVSSLTIKGLVKILFLILSCIAKFRVRKYAKFGIFCAKIVQMTPQRLRRESLRLQKFSVTNREPLRLQKFSVTNTVLSLPFSQQIQFTLIINVVNLN